MAILYFSIFSSYLVYNIPVHRQYNSLFKSKDRLYFLVRMYVCSMYAYLLNCT